MDNGYQQIMQELNKLKNEVFELKKELAGKDKDISELKRLLSTSSEDVRSNVRELTDIINSNDPMLCYQYVLKHRYIDYTELEKIVIDSKDLEANYLFMINIPECNRKEHLKVIIDSKNPEYNYYAAIYGKLSLEDINIIKNIILDSKSLEYIYRFVSDLKYIYNIEDVSSVDISSFEKVIIDSLDFKYYYLFCSRIKNAHVDQFKDVLLNNASINNIDALFNFAIDIDKSNLLEYRNKIIELYKTANVKEQKDIIKEIDLCEKRKIKCLFRNSFADSVVVE